MDTTFWLVLILGLAALAQLYRMSSKIDADSRRLERKVDSILKHLGLESNQDNTAQIMELMKAGQKIQAIKLYREQTGVGLKEAKDYVERL